ncbi:unnamed protein product [Pedinophyceae sp. YPF-701]|nr:unnamed protein product [Pedinophyceae sp. YPF-701]
MVATRSARSRTAASGAVAGQPATENLQEQPTPTSRATRAKLTRSAALPKRTFGRNLANNAPAAPTPSARQEKQTPATRRSTRNAQRTPVAALAAKQADGEAPETPAAVVADTVSPASIGEAVNLAPEASLAPLELPETGSDAGDTGSVHGASSPLSSFGAAVRAAAVEFGTPGTPKLAASPVQDAPTPVPTLTPGTLGALADGFAAQLRVGSPAPPVGSSEAAGTPAARGGGKAPANTPCVAPAANARFLSITPLAKALQHCADKASAGEGGSPVLVPPATPAGDAFGNLMAGVHETPVPAVLRSGLATLSPASECGSTPARPGANPPPPSPLLAGVPIPAGTNDAFQGFDKVVNGVSTVPDAGSVGGKAQMDASGLAAALRGLPRDLHATPVGPTPEQPPRCDDEELLWASVPRGTPIFEMSPEPGAALAEHIAACRDGTVAPTPSPAPGLAREMDVVVHESFKEADGEERPRRRVASTVVVKPGSCLSPADDSLRTLRLKVAQLKERRRAEEKAASEAACEEEEDEEEVYCHIKGDVEELTGAMRQLDVNRPQRTLLRGVPVPRGNHTVFDAAEKTDASARGGVDATDETAVLMRGEVVVRRHTRFADDDGAPA